MKTIHKYPLLSLALFAIFIRGAISFLYWGPLRNSPWTGHIYVDIWSWIGFLENSAKGLIPYVDYSKEYPVAIGLVFWCISQLLDKPLNPDQLLNIHNFLFSSLEVINVLLFYKILKTLNVKQSVFYSAVYLLLPTNLVLTSFRYESLVNIFFFSGILMYLKNQKFYSSMTLSAGAAMKWYPIFFLAVSEWKHLIESKSNKSILRNLAGFLFIFGLINIPFIFMGLYYHDSIENWLNTYLFHIQRPLYWDTPLGVLTLWFGEIPYERLASPLSLLAMILLFFVKPRLDVIAKTIIITAAALVFNRVYSTQFHLWFIPLCIIYLSLNPKKYYLIFLFLILEVLNIFVYPISFTYMLMEIGGFSDRAAILHNGGCWTQIFSVAIFLRAFFLLELIVYLLDLKNKIIICITQLVRFLVFILIVLFFIKII